MKINKIEKTEITLEFEDIKHFDKVNEIIDAIREVYIHHIVDLTDDDKEIIEKLRLNIDNLVEFYL